MAYNYHCFNTANRDECTQCSSTGGVKSDDNAPFVCPHSQDLLKLMGETVVGKLAPRMTKAEIKKDRTERSHKDFVNNVLPTINDQDVKKHHLKKIGYKG